MDRPKLSIREQVKHMAEKKGIKFDIASQDEAESFLAQNNYYFKVKAYAKNYPKNKDNKYVNLDFAYLVELSKLDMYFRREILLITLDIEHFLKVRLLKDISENSREDGYDIVKDFFKQQPGLEADLRDRKEKHRTSACQELIEKRDGNYSVWVLVELISFRALIDLFDLYYEGNNPASNRLYPLKFLRNAAAHNNCLLNNLHKTFEIDANRAIMKKLADGGITGKMREKKMSNKVIHDFVVTLDLFCDIASSGAKRATLTSLHELFYTRFAKNENYFKGNAVVTSGFEFFRKVVDFYSR